MSQNELIPRFLTKSQLPLIRKDINAVVKNKQYFLTLLLVPLLFTVVFPIGMVLITFMIPIDTSDFTQILAVIPESMREADERLSVFNLLFNMMLPLFFLLIPIMASSVMAASSFVGERQKHTLETLCYTPLNIKQIFQAKVYAAVVMSLSVTYGGFIVMIVVVNIVLGFLGQNSALPSLTWLFVLILLVPALSLLTIVLIVKTSVKSKSIEEAQQKSVFFVLPIIMVLLSQFSGLFLINQWIFGVIGIVLLTLSLVVLQKSMGKYTYERILK